MARPVLPTENAFIESVLRSMNVDAFDKRVVDHLRTIVACRALDVVNEAKFLADHREARPLVVQPRDVRTAIDRTTKCIKSTGISERRTEREKGFLKVSKQTARQKRGAPATAEHRSKRARSRSSATAAAAAAEAAGFAARPPHSEARSVARKAPKNKQITIKPLVK